MVGMAFVDGDRFRSASAARWRAWTRLHQMHGAGSVIAGGPMRPTDRQEPEAPAVTALAPARSWWWF